MLYKWEPGKLSYALSHWVPPGTNNTIDMTSYHNTSC